MNRKLGHGMTLIDLKYRGRPGYIAAGVIDSGEGLLLVDPGPAVTLGALHKGLELLAADIGDVTTILLTHIHLDHAGGVGTLLRQNPRIQVLVHQRGARHLADPTRLVESATRIYGNLMETLWGEIAPVPAERITPLEGGERLLLGRRAIEVAYTPGHAVHHVSFLDAPSGHAWVGDTAGLLLVGGRFALPVTPPPDIDLEAWRQSHDTIGRWKPARLIHTHFGPGDDPASHLDRHETMLADWGQRVRASLAEAGTDTERADRFMQSVEAGFQDVMGADQAARIGFGGVRDSWHGLARYWRTRSPE
ncbi:MAG: MBL fold metallo-hydrolase [Gemmatimonadota bacterium]|nr:MBL fold metallo-hydrolase [Gemmatimonadota bacterium]